MVLLNRVLPRERGGTVKVWTIYRVHCVQCAQVKEFQSEQAARSYINEHQRGHDSPPINWTSTENVETST